MDSICAFFIYQSMQEKLPVAGFTYPDMQGNRLSAGAVKE